MLTTWQTIIWHQFGAAIDMLENAINACPENVWGDRSRNPEYWYTVYHTLFFLDFYCFGTDKGFLPPKPFNLDELDPAGILPDRVYRKEEMLTYLEHGRNRARAAVAALTEDSFDKRCAYERPDVTNAELIVYSMRHVQHHAAQLNLILRQTIDSAPRWVSKARAKL